MQKSIRKKKLGGFPAVGVIVSMTLALFVLGVFGLLMSYSKQLEQQVRKNVKLQVYLRSGLSPTQRLQIENQLIALPFVATDGENKLAFVSKEEAAKQFIAETGEDFTKLLGENPLHDAYLVSIRGEQQLTLNMDSVKKKVEKISGVFQAYYVAGLMESVNENITKISFVLAGILLVLLLTVGLLINSTLRIALFSQRFLIRSMQLVGAKHWFIRKPFLFHATLYGIIAGVLAGGFVWLLADYGRREIPDLQVLYQPETLWILTGTLVFLGASIAFISTMISMNRYLKMSLDELY